MGRNVSIPKELMNLNEQIEVTPTGDDKGVIFENQVSVEGEIIAGEDSYPVPLAFHCTLADTTGKTIINATDISSILQSDNGSVTGMFNGTSSGNYILLASHNIFEGVKVKYDTLGTVEPANIVAESYQDDINTWVTTSCMATNSSYPFRSTAWNISQHITEQIFFGFNPLTVDEENPWTTQTFNINGVNYENYYWSRCRITSDITLDPIVQQIKLHTDRIEHEALGIFKFGRARSPKLLVSSLSSTITNALEDPSNRDIEYTTTFTADTTNNRLQHLRDDGFGIVATREFGIDSSIPLVVAVSYYVEGTDTGVVEFTIKGSQVGDGYVYDGNNASNDYTVTDEVLVNSNEIRRTVQALIPINELDSDSAVLIEVSRLGSSSAVDTLADDIVVTNVSVTGYVWKI